MTGIEARWHELDHASTAAEAWWARLSRPNQVLIGATALTLLSERLLIGLWLISHICGGAA